MRPRHRPPIVALLALFLFIASGCQIDSQNDARSVVTSRSASLRLARTPSVDGIQPIVPDADRFPDTFVLSWGPGDNQVGLVPYAVERPPVGPMSISLSPTGSVWLLDQVNDRLVELSPEGQWLGELPCPLGAIDMAVDPTGRPAVLSLINHRVTFVDDDGLGEHVPVPLSLRLISGLSFDGSGALLLETGYQETLSLGRPGEWIAYPNQLRTKSDGIRRQGGGPLRQTMLRDGGAVLLEPIAGSREAVEVELEGTQGVASAALVASLSDRSAVVLLERFRGDSVVRVIQRVDADGRLIAREVLPRAPLYFPYREFAVASNGTLLHLHPIEEGLTIRAIRLAREEVSP